MLSVRIDEETQRRLTEVCRRYGYSKGEAVKRSVDTGFLVALFNAKDPLHASANAVLAESLKPAGIALVSVWPTLVETCFFLDVRGKSALLEWIRRGGLRLRPIENEHLPAIMAVLEGFPNPRSTWPTLASSGWRRWSEVIAS